MSTEHSPASLAVAHTPGPWQATKARPGDRSVCIRQANGVLEIGKVGLWKDGSGEANAALVAAAPDLLAACEAWLAGYDGDCLYGKDEPGIAEMRAAVARARGLRPCDVAALVPKVLQAQPQCVHGEHENRRAFLCPLHRVVLGTQRNEHPTNGGVWYTYVCDGFLSDQKESAE